LLEFHSTKSFLKEEKKKAKVPVCSINNTKVSIVYTVSFMPAIASTSGRLHLSDFILIDSFSAQVKSKVGLDLDKTAALRITLNLDGTPIISKSHTHPSHSETSRPLTSSLSLGIPVPRSTQSIRDM
jgi:hypothetical protein